MIYGYTHGRLGGFQIVRTFYMHGMAGLMLYMGIVFEVFLGVYTFVIQIILKGAKIV